SAEDGVAALEWAAHGSPHMARLRDRVGLNVPPLFLRLTLGVVFIWAGLGKISQSFEVTGNDAAILANMGAIDSVPAVIVPLSPGPTPPPPRPRREEGKPRPRKPSPAGGEPPNPGSAALNRPGTVLAGFQPPNHSPAADFATAVKVRMVYGLAIAIHNAAFPP